MNTARGNAVPGENVRLRYANLPPRPSNVVERPAAGTKIGTSERRSNVRRRGDERPAVTIDDGQARRLTDSAKSHIDGTGSQARRSNVRKAMPAATSSATRVSLTETTEADLPQSKPRSERTSAAKPRFVVDLRRISRDARHALAVSSGLEHDILTTVLCQLDVLALSIERGLR